MDNAHFRVVAAAPVVMRASTPLEILRVSRKKDVLVRSDVQTLKVLSRSHQRR